MTYYNLYNGYSNDPGSLLSLAFRTTAKNKSSNEPVKLFGKESYDEGYLTGFGAGLVQASPQVKILAVGENKVRLFKTYSAAQNFLGFNLRNKGGIESSVFKNKAVLNNFTYTGRRKNKKENYKLFRNKSGGNLDQDVFAKNVDLNSKDLNKIYLYDNSGKNIGKVGLEKSKTGKLFSHELIDDLDT